MSLPPQSLTYQDFYSSHPLKSALVSAYAGKSISQLRTPALVIDRAVFARNCAKMHKGVGEWGALFRAHVKTHKTAEGTKYQLASSSGTTHAIVVSTLAEAWGIIAAGLVKDGTVKDMLYGLPVGPTKLDDLNAVKIELEKYGAELRLMIDHPDQVHAVEAYAKAHDTKPWSAFVKTNTGNMRSGLYPSDPALRTLLELLIPSPSISIFGFYCHAGQAYKSHGLSEASDFLSGELRTTNDAAKVALSLLSSSSSSANHHHNQPFVLSVGSTPTATAAVTPSTLTRLSQELSGQLEIHAGNYPLLDLQMLGTGLIQPSDIAHRVLTSVVSYYPNRGELGSDEAVCDAGALAMTKDTGPIPGYGDVVGPKEAIGWRLGKLSQEHGVLVRTEPAGPRVPLGLGTMLEVVSQHVCLTAAAYPWYYVVDSSGEGGSTTVVDVWVPWKAW